MTYFNFFPAGDSDRAGFADLAAFHRGCCTFPEYATTTSSRTPISTEHCYGLHLFFPHVYTKKTHGDLPDTGMSLKKIKSIKCLFEYKFFLCDMLKII